MNARIQEKNFYHILELITQMISQILNHHIWKLIIKFYQEK